LGCDQARVFLDYTHQTGVWANQITESSKLGQLHDYWSSAFREGEAPQENLTGTDENKKGPLASGPENLKTER
jgi:hypothetical protein